MAILEVPCMRCKNPLSFESGGAPAHELSCTACGALQVQRAYPALAAPLSPPAPDEIAALSEHAVCFNHASAPAASVCDACGRYLCSLCHLDVPESVNGPAGLPRIACPGCFAKLRQDELRARAWDLFRNRYPRHDLAALMLAGFPIILFPAFIFTPFTVLLALYLMIRYWRDCRDPVRRYRANLVIAAALMLLTLLIWAVFAGLTAASFLGGGGVA